MSRRQTGRVGPTLSAMQPDDIYICAAGSTCGDGQQEWDAFTSLLQRWTADPQSLMSRKALRSDGSASFSTTRDTDAGVLFSATQALTSLAYESQVCGVKDGCRVWSPHVQAPR